MARVTLTIPDAQFDAIVAAIDAAVPNPGNLAPDKLVAHHVQRHLRELVRLGHENPRPGKSATPTVPEDIVVT